MTNNKIQGYAERIENVLNEIDALKGDIKDLYEEVKSADIKPKVLRKAIANKRRKTDAQFEAEVEEYAAALLAMPGATYRSVAEQTGISKSKLQRRVPRKENGTPHHNPETGEITEACGGVEGHTSEDTAGSGETKAACNEPVRSIGKPAAAGIESGPQEPSAERPALQEVGAGPARPKGTPIPDDLAIPAFLDQRKRQVHA